MKAEGGMAAATVLHKVKVKEETKECCGYQQSSSTCSTSSGSSGIATVTGSSASTHATTVTTLSNGSGNDTGSDNGSGNGVSSHPAVAAPSTTALPNASPASTAVVCHPSTPAPSHLANADPFPVDLDLKTKAKASSTAREKATREEGQSEVHSPPSHHQRIPTAASSNQQKQSNGLRCEYKGATACSRSSDNDSPLPSHPLKPEFEDAIGAGGGGNGGNGGSDGGANAGAATGCRTEEQSDVSVSSNNSTGSRCIAGVFAGHTELKSVLGTVVKFATGISPDTGDTVLTLVLALLSGGMTAEEFHSALQEATNYSLKGFVLPHLKQQLPSLQRDLSNAARTSNQSCAQFLRSNEAAILEAVGLVSPGESVEVFGEHAGNGGNQCSAHYGMRSNSNPGVGGNPHVNNTPANLHHYSGSASHAPKRRASDTPYYENGALLDDIPMYGKRLTNPWSHHHPPQQQQPSTDGSSPYCWYHPLHSSSGSIQSHGHRLSHNHGHGHGHGHGHVHGHGHGHSHGPSPIPPNPVQMNQMNPFSGSHHLAQQPQQQQQQMSHVQTQNGSLDDEWKNIHMMLNCILGMVEKTKKALAILQTRGCFGPAATVPPTPVGAQNGNSNTVTVNNPSSTNGSQVESSTGDREGSLKRLSGEIVAQTIRAIEDKVAELQRKDEEAVKRAVMAEVQRAVRAAVAETRTNERLRVHRLLDTPLSQRNHGALRQGPYLRVHGNPGAVDTSPRTVTTPTSVSNSIPSTTEDEKESHLQTVSGSSCWNCGRPALETCGGCGIARYCGSFCQHRDWEAGGHHATCNNPPHREPRRSTSRSPPRVASGGLSTTVNEATVASPIAAGVTTKGK
ncbi:CBFA2/RUNX1 partner transcriptional co-repressor nervy [Osmia lignaria lignaria]|uniref:CBFA2/RUNX1 partner transcriptional co-repressor nervy n=1 Tax=Osmia lignaria lignaria TaxID=1437193 RepID=UPI00402B1CB2